MRIRTIKPEFWQSEDLAEISDKAKLLAIGLLNMADDEGYLKAHPSVIKSQLFPFTEESLNIQGMLIELSNAGYLTILTGEDGKQYVCINNFLAHQKVNRPTPSKIKGSMQFTECSVNDHEQLTIGKERKGKERKGTGKEKDMSDKSDADIVFDYWVEVMGKGANSIFNAKRKKAVKARLQEGYTVEQIKQAVLGCSMTPHNMGKNDNNKLYNDLELICRDGSNVERFAGNAEYTQVIPQYSAVTERNLALIETMELK